MTATLNTRPAAHGRWALPDDVFLAGGDPEARLVDLNRGRFYALDPVARRMVELALAVDDAEVGETVAGEFGESPAVAAVDWADFRNGLRTAGLLVPASREPRRETVRSGRPPVGRPPGRRAVWFLLFRCWASLRLVGWAGTVRRLRAAHPPEAVCPATTEPGAAVELIDALVRRTAAGMLVNPECKERAVTAWHLLRTRYGLPARLVVGIRPYPFEAHAWVECAGRFVTDDADAATLFTPVATYD